MSIPEGEALGKRGHSAPRLGTLVECVQHPIHEAGGIGTAVLLGQADPLLDRDLRRDFIHMQELDRSQAEDTPIDHSKPPHTPVLQRLTKETVHLGNMLVKQAQESTK